MATAKPDAVENSKRLTAEQLAANFSHASVGSIQAVDNIRAEMNQSLAEVTKLRAQHAALESELAQAREQVFDRDSACGDYCREISALTLERDAYAASLTAIRLAMGLSEHDEHELAVDTIWRLTQERDALKELGE